jgi:transposase
MSSHSNRFPALHLEIFTDRRGTTPYHYGLFRSSFRKDGKVKHRTYGRVTGLPLRSLQALRDFVRRGCPGGDLGVTCVTKSARELGACRAVLELVEELGLPRLIYSRREPWVKHILAMIVGRIVYQGSKLSLVNLWEDSALWEVCGLGTQRPDVDACYAALDRLRARQKPIQKQLARRHLQEGCGVMYDASSSYLEGAYRGSRLVAFGHNRDGKRGHAQVVYGMLTDATGCPVGLAVYPGNTADQTTVKDRVKELKQDYGVKQALFAGDRGMLTPARLAELNQAGLWTVTALTHPQMTKLIERRVIQLGLFDERDIAEVVDPAEPSVRYLLCRNPLTAEKETRTRKALLAKTCEALERLAASRKRRTPEQIGAAVGVALKKWRVGKFFAWKVEAGKLIWSRADALVAQEAALDGCYVVRTDAPAAQWDKQQAVDAYRRLADVDRGFRQLKTVSLEVRPVYHKKDERIEAHLFVCLLAYYVQWHMQQRLAPLFAADGQGKDRRWTFAHVLERLKSIRRETVVMQATEMQIDSRPDAEQQQLLDLLAGRRNSPAS